MSYGLRPFLDANLVLWSAWFRRPRWRQFGNQIPKFQNHAYKIKGLKRMPGRTNLIDRILQSPPPPPKKNKQKKNIQKKNPDKDWKSYVPAKPEQVPIVCRPKRLFPEISINKRRTS